MARRITIESPTMDISHVDDLAALMAEELARGEDVELGLPIVDTIHTALWQLIRAFERQCQAQGIQCNIDAPSQTRLALESVGFGLAGLGETLTAGGQGNG